MGAENGDARRAGELRRVADALSRLVKQHFDLARAELRVDASRWRQDATVGLAAVPFAAIGLLLLDLSLAALLARAIGVPGALALLGTVNLTVGGALALLAVRRIGARRAALRGTAEELRRNQQTLQVVGRGAPPHGHPNHVHPVRETGRQLLQDRTDHQSREHRGRHGDTRDAPGPSVRIPGPG